MRTTSPPISVIMPVYNAENYLARAIDSILDQTFSDFEFIIVDDGSTDSSWKIILDYARKDKRIIPVRNDKNLNISNSLNRAIELVKGKYIARMDADDWSYPSRLEIQYKFMLANPNVVLLGSNVYFCDENFAVLNVREYPQGDKLIRKKIFKYSPFCHAVTFILTDAMRKAGSYNPDLYDAEDYDLYFRLGRIGKMENLPNILYKVRTYSLSVSQTKVKRQEKLALFIRIRAIMEYGYRMTVNDSLFLILEFLLGIIIPARFKFKLFNYLRRRNLF